MRTGLQQQEQRHRRHADYTLPQCFDLTLRDAEDDEADFFPGAIREGCVCDGDMKKSDNVATISVVSGIVAAPKRKSRIRSGEDCAAEDDNKKRFSTAEGDHAPAKLFTEAVA